MDAGLLSLGEEMVGRALSEGADSAEAFLVRSRIVSVEVKGGEIKAASSRVREEVGIRAVSGGKLGFAHASGSSNALRIVKAAIENMAASPPDPNLRGLPAGRRPTDVAGLYDPKLADLPVSDAVELMTSAVESASVGPKIRSISGELSASRMEVAVVNSEGVSASEERTSSYLEVYVAASDGTESSTGYEFNEGRRLDEIDPEWVGSKSAELALASLSQVRPETGDYPVVIDPTAAPMFLGFMVSSAANAENVQYGRSFLCGKLGERIGREGLSLIDDGTLEGGLKSAGFDDEGVPTRRTEVIRDGVLSSYIHNHYTASKEGIESTGNAVRSPSSLPRVGSHNVIFEASQNLRFGEDELLDLDRGIYLKFTGDVPNLANGEFSGLIQLGFLIERGEITRGLKEANFGLSLLDLLRNVDAVGREPRSVMGTVSPSFRVRSVRVAGG